VDPGDIPCDIPCDTPYLALDLDVLDRNLERTAAVARERGLALRPHAKTHKCVEIARLQVAAGAVGVCCAKLGEAEALVEGGIESVLITSPVVTAPAIARLFALAAHCRELRVVVDHPDNAAALGAGALTAGRTLEVLVDVDPGIRRTGVPTPEAALELASAIAALPALRYRGVQMYCGLQQHVASYAEREAAIRERTQYLQSILALLAKHGHSAAIVSGSGTGTHAIDAELGVLTEWQVGSYLFMDRQYAECESGNHGPAFEHALFVDSSVVSANTQGMATIDAGFKALATDGGPPRIVSGAPEGSAFHFMGDEHGLIVDPGSKHRWKLGDRVRLVPPHCDPTVNLYDSYHVLRDDTLEAIWPVSARGRSR
jgi:D-serine deaminase-like pyridoxal phosphate-dependent protein